MNPGDLISGKYRLLRLLGSGGMGSVWAARNELTDRDFAIKFLAQRLASNHEALQRFFHEARACGQLKHPAVVEVYDMGQAEDGTPYIVMEMLEGEGMDQRLAREGRFNPADAAAWISFVARGLDEAHMRGIVHRDLKPGNIFFALDDRGDVLPKVLDFGISKATGPQRKELAMTMQGTVLGSPAYMSPEQARGDLDVDARSDVWALGVILYEALTGKVPFDASNYNALMVEIITRPHTPVNELSPICPSSLAQVVDQALVKDRDRRIPSARELADRLEQVLMQISGPSLVQFQPRASMLSTRPPPMVPSVPPVGTTAGPWSDAAPTLIRPRRSRTPYVVAGAGALALVVAGVLLTVRGGPPAAAVARHASTALRESLARAHDRIVLVKEEAVVEEKRRQAEEEAARAAKAAEEAKAAASAGPASVPVASGVGVKTPGKPAGKKNDDPHGGVEGPGF